MSDPLFELMFKANSQGFFSKPYNLNLDRSEDCVYVLAELFFFVFKNPEETSKYKIVLENFKELNDSVIDKIMEISSIHILY